MKKLVVFIIFLLPIFSCKKDDTEKDDNSICEKIIFIDNNKFAGYPSDPLTISDVVLKNNCLEVSFGASGCNSQSWIIELVGAEEVLYSDPPQRSIRLSLINNEACLAALGKTITFDLNPARVSGEEIILNLTGWSNPIRYKY